MDLMILLAAFLHIGFSQRTFPTTIDTGTTWPDFFNIQEQATPALRTIFPRPSPEPFPENDENSTVVYPEPEQIASSTPTSTWKLIEQVTKLTRRDQAKEPARNIDGFAHNKPTYWTDHKHIEKNRSYIPIIATACTIIGLLVLFLIWLVGMHQIKSKRPTRRKKLMFHKKITIHTNNSTAIRCLMQSLEKC